MGIAADMKKLTEDIIISHDMRVKAVGALVNDVHKTLKGFATDRKRMSKEQAKNLADFVDDLKKDVDNLKKNTRDMLKDFRKNHKQMSNDQAKRLAGFVKNLTNDVDLMLDDARSMLDGFQKDRVKMSKELKQKLAKEVKEIETYVNNKLKEFSDARADMSGELKKMAANWQSMAATMAKRRGIKPKVGAKVKVRPVEEAIEEEEGMEDRILEVLEENPNGITLVEMAYAIGVPFQKLTGPTRRLIAEGEVRKEDKLYFLA